MNYISVNRAVTVAWIIIALIAAVTVLMMATIMFQSSEHGWPAYVSIPVAFILPIGFMILGFTVAGPKWIAWAYLHVADVKELERAWQLSGFGAYSVESLKNEETKRRINERFEHYHFEDDLSVPYQTEIYFKKPYQTYGFLASTLLTILFVYLIITSNSIPQAFVLPIGTAVVAFVIYFKSSDSSPQLTLSQEGINTDDMLCEWKDISEFDVLQGKISYLTFVYKEERKEIMLDKLAVSNRKINHLMHVYCQRSTANVGKKSKEAFMRQDLGRLLD